MKRMVSAAVILALPIALLAASPEALFTAGKQALLRGENARAADLFEQAVKLRPGDSQYHFWLGRAYGRQAREASLMSRMGLGKRTREEFERAVELDPNNLDARFGLLEFYLVAPGFMGGSEEKAKQQAIEIRKRDPQRGHSAFARIYLSQKKPDLARKEYVDSVREQPAAPQSHYHLAVFLMGEKNYKQALEEFESALRLDPSYMPAYFRIGQLAVLANSNHTRGEEALKKYLAYQPAEDEPAPARAWYWLGGIYEKLGKKSEARQSYSKSLQLFPGAKDVTEALKRVSS